MKTPLLRMALLFVAAASLVTLSSCGIGGGYGGTGNGSTSGASGSSGGGTTGSGGATTPNSILNGKYAFNFSGTTTSTGAPIVLAGSFTADGAGKITAGIEDINQVGLHLSTGVAITGTYSIGSDGRGTLNIVLNGGSTQTFKIAIENGNHGQLIRFDTGAAGSGTFDLQTSSAFALSALSGTYAFEWNGSDAGNNPFSGIGEVNLSSGAATGAADINDGGNYGQAATSGTLQAPDANGHGTATFTYGGTAYTYAYDIISASRLLLIELDTNGATVGEADLQTAAFNTSSLSGNYAFFLNAMSQGFGMVGQVVTDGQGNITSSDSVENNFGTLNSGAFAGTYALASTIQSATVNGRFTMTATEPSGFADNFVVYLVSPNQAFVMETDPDQLTFGQLLTQTGSPYTSSALNGNYGLNVTGIDSNSVEVDVVGQFAAAGTATLTAGTLDINGEDLTPPTAPNSAISGGSYSVTNNTSGQGTINFTTSTTSTGTLPFQFAFYFVSPNQIFLLQVDNQFFISMGSALSQPTIP